MPASPRPAGGTVLSVHIYLPNDDNGPAGGTEPRAGGSDLNEVYNCHSVNSHLKREMLISVNSNSRSYSNDDFAGRKVIVNIPTDQHYLESSYLVTVTAWAHCGPSESITYELIIP